MNNIDISRVQGLLDEFSDCSEKAKALMGTMLGQITNGNVPSQDKLEELGIRIDELRSRYDSMLELAVESLPAEEMPADGSAIGIYADALIENANSLESKIESAKTTLLKFIAIKSKLDKYTNAIKVFQDEALGLLKEIDDGNAEAVIGSEFLDNSAELVAVIENDDYDFDSEEASDFLDKVDEVFSKEIERGVTRGKYYIDEDAVAEIPVAEVETAELTAEEPEEVPVAEEPEEVPVEEESEEEIPVEEAPEETTWESVGISNPEDVISHFDDSMLSVEEAKKKKDFSVSRFISDMKHPSYGSLCYGIMAVIKDHDGTTMGDMINLAKLVDVSEEAMQISFEKLIQWGYIKRCTVEGYEDLYYPTENGMKVFSTKKSAEHLKITPNKDIKSTVNETADSVLSRVMNIKYKVLINSLDLEGKAISVSTDDDCFIITHEDVFGEGKHLISSGIISKNPEQFRILIEEARKVLFKEATFIASGITKEAAKRHAQWIADNISEEILPERFFYADIFSGKIYDFLTDEEASPAIEEQNAEEEKAETEETVKAAEEETAEEEMTVSEPAEQPDPDEIPVSETETVPDSDETENETVAPAEPETEPAATEEETAIEITEEIKDFDSVTDENFTEYCRGLSQKASMPSEKEIFEIVKKLLSGSKHKSVASAELLLGSVSEKSGYDECANLRRQLLYATCKMNSETDYCESGISTAFAEKNPFTEELMLATYLRTMIHPGNSFDYALPVRTKQILKNFDIEFPAFAYIKPLYDLILKVAEPSNNYGFSKAIIREINNEANKDILLANIRKEAETLISIPTSANHQPLKLTYGDLFDGKSDLGRSMSLISSGETEDRFINVASVLERFMGNEEKIFDSVYKSNCDTSDKACPPNLKTKGVEAVKSRVAVIKEWLELFNSTNGKFFDIEKMSSLRDQIAKRIDSCLDSEEIESAQVLKMMLINIKEYISGRRELTDTIDCTELFYTGVLPLDDSGKPILNPLWNSIHGFEPWRLILRHIVSKSEINNDAQTVLDRIDDFGSGIYDNLNQFLLINEAVLGKKVQANEFNNRLEDAKESANLETENFFASAEWACALGQISENEKDELNDYIYTNKEVFYSAKSFGCWRQFISVLNDIIKEKALRRVKEKEVELAEISEQIKKISDEGDKAKAKSLYAEIEKLVNDEHNFSAAEEYISHFNSGNYELTSDLGNELGGNGEFIQFLKCCDEIATSINKTSNQSPRDFINAAKRYLGLTGSLNNAYKKNAERILESFPANKGSANNASSIKSLFEAFGFSVTSVTKNKDISANLPSGFTNCEVFDMNVALTSVKGEIDYPHPIAAFGTKINNPVPVVVFYGGNDRMADIANITAIGLRKPTIVLHVGCSAALNRASFAKKLHEKDGLTTYLVIDRVLLVYLAKKAMNETRHLVPSLLECTLPYTKYQPFGEANSSTPEEMFCGRSKELESLVQSTAPYFIYGGRQLGKTALLDRVCSYITDKDDKTYAIKISILNESTEEEVVSKIVRILNLECDDMFENCNTTAQLSDQIQRKLNNGSLKKLILCLDEADNFFGNISKNKYAELNAFDELAAKTKGQFNFIAAGLHNVCKAKNALSNNGIFGHFNPLCIKPLSPAESLRLIYKPLRYLGFTIDKNELPFLMTMLAKTNYYPGLVQLFGNKLVNSIKEQYAKGNYDVNNAPPFTIRKEQVKDVAVSEELRNEIKKKLDMTLDVDKAQYHYLAKVLALLWYEDNDNNPENKTVPLYRSKFSVDDIYSWVEMLPYMEGVSKSHTQSLLEEMVDMGILTVTDSKYSFKRRSFIELIAPSKEALSESLDKKEGEDDD